jgi:hypothetical protein
MKVVPQVRVYVLRSPPSNVLAGGILEKTHQSRRLKQYALLSLMILRLPHPNN